MDPVEIENIINKSILFKRRGHKNNYPASFK